MTYRKPNFIAVTVALLSSFVGLYPNILLDSALDLTLSGQKNTVEQISPDGITDIKEEKKVIQATKKTNLFSLKKNESANHSLIKEINPTETQKPEAKPSAKLGSFFDVPFYSQFDDITSNNWKKVGCGVASLGMIIDYYKPGETYVDALLDEGINSGAYIKDAGWSHQGLINLAKRHGLSGEAFDYASMDMNTAFKKFTESVEQGPVIASVHYTFEPTNPIPHLAVINGIEGDILYYSDPAKGRGEISIEKFKLSWKKRYITILN